MACPFKLGDKWRLKDPTKNVTATVTRVLMSRKWRDFQAWGNASERVDFLQFPFPESDEHGRGKDTVIDVETWERVP